MNSKQKTAIYRNDASYPINVPFHPSESYPEYPFPGNRDHQANAAYHAIRESFHLLSLDMIHYGSSDWNPIGELIQPGDHVLLKPNLIRESHTVKKNEWEQVITHPSIIRAVLDYVFIALKGRGKVTIADGPQTDSDFDEIKRRTHLDEIVTFFKGKGLDICLLDLRRDRWLQKDGVTYKRVPLPGDPAEYATIHLDGHSEFINYLLSGRFYGADYDMAETAKYHVDGKHAYVLCRTPLDADVLINIPKMKTHKKTGVTLSLKNMVGINGYRNCLPHHTIGTPDEGGDEFPVGGVKNRLQSRGIITFKKMLVALGGTGGIFSRLGLRIGRKLFGDTRQVVRSGNWYGNDTAWRMVLDLNKALFYFDGSGQLRKKPFRYMTIVDGIVAGEGDGPSEVDAKQCGVVIAGFNPVAVDTVCATIMGFDYHKIPMLARAWKIQDYPLVDFGTESVECFSNSSEWNGSLEKLSKSRRLGFKPYFGWKGHIEDATLICDK